MSNPEPERNENSLKTALTGLFSAYKERTEQNPNANRFTIYTESLDYPEHFSGDIFHIFGSFPEDERPSRPTLLTIISGNSHTRIVAACNWVNDWPEILAYEATVDSLETDSTLIVNKLALRLRFNKPNGHV